MVEFLIHFRSYKRIENNFKNTLYLNSVNGALMRHKWGQEALISKLTNVTRHVSSIHQYLQVTWPGCRTVNY